MTKIDTQRLGVLIDHGADATAAANAKSEVLMDSLHALRDHGTLEQALSPAELHLVRNGALTEKVAAKVLAWEQRKTSLEASVTRRRAEHAVAASRASAWVRYSDSLKSLARQHGVVL